MNVYENIDIRSYAHDVQIRCAMAGVLNPAPGDPGVFG